MFGTRGGSNAAHSNVEDRTSTRSRSASSKSAGSKRENMFEDLTLRSLDPEVIRR